jgi:hypothetical protein
MVSNMEINKDFLFEHKINFRVLEQQLCIFIVLLGYRRSRTDPDGTRRRPDQPRPQARSSPQAVRARQEASGQTPLRQSVVIF